MNFRLKSCNASQEKGCVAVSLDGEGRGVLEGYKSEL